MPVTNQELLDTVIKVNTDPYGKYVVNTAIKVMEYLDKDDTPLSYSSNNFDMHSPHGLICKADIDCGDYGITGFQASCVTAIIRDCHSRGDEFVKASKRSSLNTKENGENK